MATAIVDRYCPVPGPSDNSSGPRRRRRANDSNDEVSGRNGNRHMSCESGGRNTPKRNHSSSDKWTNSGVIMSTSCSCQPGEALRFRPRKVLHKSLFGEVVRAEDTATGEKVALKTSYRVRVEGTEDPSNELRLLRKIKCLGGHEHVIDLIWAVEDEKQVKIALPHFPLDLFKVVDKSGGLPEKSAKAIFRKILSAIKFLHSNGISHLDLSLENVLVDQEGRLKLCDFGAAREVKEGEILKNVIVGKLNYAAPEVLDNIAFEPLRADIYSLGSMLFTMLFGHPIYDLDNQNGKVAMRYATSGIKGVKQLLRAYGYTSGNPKTPSIEAVDLIGQLLQRDPSSRPTLEDIEKHPWIREI
eukprot:CAMPEP_0114526820 /NCGR_PEP_ID=MMETSP0109-20121206/23253_1 /TAXON_ID=29199 /ORGANISM="Chlorarachnion reptans, Strain CCCM449" /LENGTH=356 /DNA_ID=CAMNT_0001708677 /DNA_START=31 /DNA_END=1101 /DNA_ORIENTATION=-